MDGSNVLQLSFLVTILSTRAPGTIGRHEDPTMSGTKWLYREDLTDAASASTISDEFRRVVGNFEHDRTAQTTTHIEDVIGLIKRVKEGENDEASAYEEDHDRGLRFRVGMPGLMIGDHLRRRPDE